MRAALARIWALLGKEFLVLLKDPKSRMVLIVPPLVQLFVFGYAASFDLEGVPYAVLNRDRGRVSQELLAGVEGSPAFRLAATLSSQSQIDQVLDDKKVLVVLHVHPDFSADLLSGRPGRVQVIIDGRNSNSALTALGYLQNIALDFSQEWIKRHNLPPAAGRLQVRFWFNPNLESRWFIVPGIMGLLALVISLLVTSLSVAREREAGTFDQLLVTPLSPWEILAGKALPGLIIGLVEATGIFLMAVLWFRVPFTGSLAALYLGVVVFLLSSVGLGLLISSFALTQQQALLGAFLFMVPAVILSGFATPVLNMPPLLQTITLANPLRHFLEMLRAVFLEGAGFDRLWHLYWPLALIGLVSLSMAGWMFRRRMH